MTGKHQSLFKSRFRAKAYGWKGSNLAIKRLKEAVSEIKKMSRTDAVTAADGAVTLFERLWPALEHIDSSSGALGKSSSPRRQAQDKTRCLKPKPQHPKHSSNPASGGATRTR